MIGNVTMPQAKVPLTLGAIEGDQLFLLAFLEGATIGEDLARV